MAQKHRYQLTTQVDEETYHKIIARAEECGVSIYTLLRQLLDEWLVREMETDEMFGEEADHAEAE